MLQCWSATPTNGREPDDFQPGAQIKRLFEESESILVAVSLTRLQGNCRLSSPKWKKQISLLNTCRRIVWQMCRFFYLGVYKLYFTKLKSRLNLYRNARGKRTVVEREVFDLWMLCHDHATHRLKKKDFSHGFKYSRTLVTRDVYRFLGYRVPCFTVGPK